MPSWRTRAARARYGQSTRRHRRARRRRLLLVVLVAVLAWLGVSAVLLALAAGDARAAEHRLRGLQASTSGSDLVQGEATDELASARDALPAASSKADFPVVAPLRVLPFVGRQVTAFQRMLSSSSGVVDAGVDALDETREQLGGDLPDEEERVQMLGTLKGVLAKSQADVVVATADLGPRDGLAQPLAEAREKLVGHLNDLAAQLARAHGVTGSLRSLLEGDGRYLVLAANNSEMQAGWGMPLQVGVLTVD